MAIFGHFSRVSSDDHLDIHFSVQQNFMEYILVLYFPRYSVFRPDVFNPPGPEKCQKYNTQKWPFFANLEGPICLRGTPWMNFQEHLRKVGFLVSKKFKSKNTHPRFRTFGRKIRCVLIFQAIYIKVYPCIILGISWNFPWIILELSRDYSLIILILSLDFSWNIHGLSFCYSIKIPRLSLDYS